MLITDFIEFILKKGKIILRKIIYNVNFYLKFDIII